MIFDEEKKNYSWEQKEFDFLRQCIENVKDSLDEIYTFNHIDLSKIIKVNQ